MTIWQVLSCAEFYPYLFKNVTYGQGRFERRKYVLPDTGNLKPRDEKSYTPFFQNMISQHRNQPKDPVRRKT